MPLYSRLLYPTASLTFPLRCIIDTSEIAYLYLNTRSPYHYQLLPLPTCVRAEWLQSHPTLCDPMDCSLPGSSVHGILQARKLEWVTTTSSRGSFQPRDRTCVFCGSCIAGGFFPLSYQGSPDCARAGG